MVCALPGLHPPRPVVDTSPCRILHRDLLYGRDAFHIRAGGTRTFPPPAIESQARPPRPGLPPRAPLFPRKEPATTSGQTTTVRYSQSAWAANMVMPAIWLGLPAIVILALIIRSMKGD